MIYHILADAVLIGHAMYVIFIVGGLVLILLGAGFQWQWVKNFRFRALHLAAIALVVLQSWFKVTCPLTTLEMYFREQGGQTPYSGTFMAHWLHQLLFYEAPFWVFSAGYTLFGLAVAATWLLIPPRIHWRRNKGEKQGGSTPSPDR
jgi:hypothetical protein